jgi:hypothetical protein
MRTGINTTSTFKDWGLITDVVQVMEPWRSYDIELVDEEMKASQYGGFIEF